MITWAKVKGTIRSATIWFNGTAGAVVVGLPFVQDALPQIKPYIADDKYKLIAGIVIGANILLRFKTHKPLDQK